MAEIKYIPVKKLWQHPDNPRKDLGDVTELAESIKVNGVLQNLTVVPLIGEITKKWDGESYRVIIGHRRLAAAKLAGLEELPCVVVEMSEREQLSTMLTENMQRSDLTVYEQAQGFQMMLDMGDTVEDIAEKSGFSATTVRRRVKLLELDKDKFKKSEERGVSLFEYMELDKLKSPERKNEMLDYIGTENFKYKLKQAIDAEYWDDTSWLTEEEIAQATGAETIAEDNEDGEGDAAFTLRAVTDAIGKTPEKALLRMIYARLGDGKSEGYFRSYWNSYTMKHEENEKLDRIYALLVKLGYEMSDDEKALQDGTHELFEEATDE